MKLSILIPTYNRMNYLLKNIDHLIQIVQNNNLTEEIEFVIAVNSATNEAIAELKVKYAKYPFIQLYFHSRLLTLCENFKFVINKANGEYCMFNGDDDFLTEEYFLKVIQYIQDTKNTLIIGNYYAVNENFEKSGYLRDIQHVDEILEIGNYKYLYYCTQITGVTFKKASVSEILEEHNVDNLYVQILCAAYNIQKGRTVYISQNPYSMMNTSNCGWSFSIDNGLFDILNNFVYLNYSKSKRLSLEILLFNKQKIRFIKSMHNANKFYHALICRKDITILFKIFLILNFPYLKFAYFIINRRSKNS